MNPTEMPSSYRSRILLSLALMSLMISGCYERTTEGNTAIYRFASWVVVAVFIASVVSMPIGWYLKRYGESSRWISKISFVLMVLPVFSLTAVVPGLLNDRVMIDDEHFEANYGFWFAPQIHSIRYADQKKMTYLNQGRPREKDGGLVLQCIGKDGQVKIVNAGDLVRFTIPEILERAGKQGIEVENRVQP